MKCATTVEARLNIWHGGSFVDRLLILFRGALTLRIQNKLFLALTGTGICLVLIMLMLMRWSIDRGMLEYVNTREAERLRPLVTQLAELYSQSNSWEAVENKPRAVHQLLRQLSEANMPPPPHSQLNRQHPADDRHLRLPPPARLTILDAQQSPVFGRYDPNRAYNLQPIMEQQQLVGWLASPKHREITQGFELTFIKQQRRAFVVISALVLVLAFVIGWPLARHFLKPIRQIAQGISELNRGNYQQLSLQRRDELGQLARDINELSATLAHNDEIRKRWLADTSHELRTPVAILRGEIEAMLDGVRPINADNIRSLHQEIQQLQKLVEDLHELSNADIGGLRYRKGNLNIAALIEQQLERHRPTIREAGLQLEYSSDAPHINAWVDASRINQLVDNLLSNSQKYTAAGGKIIVQLKHGDNELLLSVSDSAPGVPDSALEKLFEHLFRVDSSRNRSTGGSGLGLAICQRIVDGHQGKIKANHANLGGVCISISIPLNQPGYQQ